MKIKIYNYDKLLNINSFEQLIEAEHEKVGIKSRNSFDEKAQMFIISDMLKEARKEAKITQEELAEKTGTKKVIFQE